MRHRRADVVTGERQPAGRPEHGGTARAADVTLASRPERQSAGGDTAVCPRHSHLCLSNLLFTPSVHTLCSHLLFTGTACTCCTRCCQQRSTCRGSTASTCPPKRRCERAGVEGAPRLRALSCIVCDCNSEVPSMPQWSWCQVRALNLHGASDALLEEIRERHLPTPVCNINKKRLASPA